LLFINEKLANIPNLFNLANRFYYPDMKQCLEPAGNDNN